MRAAFAAALLALLLAACSGAAAPVSHPAAALRWVVKQLPGQSGATASGLASVSCPSPSFCVSVGATASGGRKTVLVERWNGAAWGVEATPALPGLAELLGVSCPSVNYCAAVGDFTLGSNRDEHVLVIPRVAGHWVSQVPVVPSGAVSAQLSAVSCPSATSCAAIGESTNVHKSSSGFLEHWNGARWAIEALPLPTSAALSAVSCPTLSFCMAVGDYAKGGQQFPIEFVEYGGTWTEKSVARPASASQPDLTALTCLSAGFCAATGFGLRKDSSAVPVQFMDVFNGVDWTVHTMPQPTAEGGLACATPQFCVAVASYDPLTGATPGTPAGFLDSWDGTSWRIDSVLSGDFELASVSCPSTQTCFAAGTGPIASSTGAPSPVIARLEP